MFQRIDYKRRKFSLGFGWMIASIVFCLGGQKIKAVEPSGTLSVITINNENNAPINYKINYIKGTYKVDPKNDDSIEASEGELQIRGRGNYTWDWFEKKPYRIKLDKKAPLLGFNKSKHFVLLALADDNLGFLKETDGF